MAHTKTFRIGGGFAKYKISKAIYKNTLAKRSLFVPYTALYYIHLTWIGFKQSGTHALAPAALTTALRLCIFIRRSPVFVSLPFNRDVIYSVLLCYGRSITSTKPSTVNVYGFLLCMCCSSFAMPILTFLQHISTTVMSHSIYIVASVVP